MPVPDRRPQPTGGRIGRRQFLIRSAVVAAVAAPAVVLPAIAEARQPSERGKKKTSPTPTPSPTSTPTPTATPTATPILTPTATPTVAPTTPPGVSFDVVEFGARGNGIANDTVAIQSAIDAAALKGGTVTFPPGRYRITASLRLTGTGVALTLDRAAVVTYDSAAVTTGALRIERASNVTVYGGTFEGQRATPSGGGGDESGTILAENVEDLTITGVTVKDANVHGIRTVTTGSGVNRRVLIDACTLANIGGDAISLYNTKDSSIRGSLIRQVRGNAVGASTGCSGLRVERNTIEQIGRMGIEVWHDGGGSTVTQNNLSGVTWHSISIAKSDGCLVAQNQMRGGGATCIEVAASHACSVSDNLITDSMGGGIVVDGDCRRTTISQNRIHASGRRAISVFSGAGSGFTPPSHTSIVNNTVTGYDYEADIIWFGHASQHALISGNVITKGGYGAVISFIDHGASDVEITGNRISFAGVRAWGIHSCAQRVTISGNRFEGCSRSVFVNRPSAEVSIVQNESHDTTEYAVLAVDGTDRVSVSDLVMTLRSGQGVVLGGTNSRYA